MEWDMKLTPWDLGELDQNAEPDIGSVVGSSVGLARQTRRLDCSVDLKLGGLGDFGSLEKWKEQPQALAMVSASSGSSKRARVPGNGGHITVCLVEGCKADLSMCREYHRRHKVCEVHSKTPVVIVNGHQQRFCQQCSRFHFLGEFDDIKRSCRKRLEGHNRRRRKPQPDSINSVILFPNQQGTKFSPYPQVYSSATIEPNWSRIIKSEDEASLYNHHPTMHFVEQQHQFPGSFSRSFREAKQFPFLQESDEAISSRMTSLETSVHKTVSLVENSNYGLTQVLDSDCALSLLSSSTQTPSINLGHMMPADRIPMAHPLGSPLQYLGLGPYSHSQASNNVSTTGFSCSGIDDGRVTTVLVRDGGDAGIHCQPMFHVSGEGSSDGASQSLPFSWE